MADATVPAAPIDRRALLTYRGSFALLIFAESMIFVTAFAARFIFSGLARPEGLELTLGVGLTALFLISAAPVNLAVHAIARGRQQAMVGWLRLTFWLGVLALAGIVFDWTTLGFAPSSRFGGTYLLATLYHAIHIVAGLITLAALWSSGRRGRFSPENHWVVEAGALLWNFVVVTWVALFAVFYLL